MILSDLKDVEIENYQDNLLTNLKSNDPAERSSAVISLLNENLNQEIIKILCSMLNDSDKGVRNSVDQVLTLNPSPGIPSNLVKYISSNKIETRNLAGEILLKIGSKSIDAMLKYLTAANDDDIKFITDLLGLIGDKKAAKSILDILKSNKNENVILACLEALGNLQYEEALNDITSFYSTNDLYKSTIFESLGKIGSSKALDFITSHYQSEDDLTKFSMIESLGIIGNEDTLFFLISELTETSGPLIWPIIDSIFHLKEKYNLDIPFEDRMKNIILNSIDEADKKYKKSAIKLLAVFESSEILPACLKIYGEDFETDEILKEKVLECPEVFFEQIPSMINTNSNNLKSLLELCSELIANDFTNYREVLTPVLMREFAESCSNCLDNSDEEVRKLGMEILFRINQEVAVLFLDKMLDDTSIWNKLKLLEILDEIESPEAVSAISVLTSDKEEMISDRARYILEGKSVIKVVPNLEENI